MIIGIDASKASSESKTGVENTIYQIILNLQKIDDKNTYYLYTDKPFKKGFIFNSNFIEKLIPMKRLWHSLRLPLALLRDKPDAFFEGSNRVPTFAPKNTTILIHDFAFKYFPSAYSKFSLIEQENSIKSALSHKAKIMVTLKANKNDLINLYHPTNKIEVIPLGFDAKPFNDLNVKRNISQQDKPYFIYVGRLEKRKNVHGIIKAFEIFKENSKNDIELILVGKKGFGYEEIKQAIDDSKFSKFIVEKGYIEDSELISLLINSKGLIYPSLYEGFGFPVLEGFSAGVPVIISDTPTLKEVASNCAIVVNPEKPIDIANKLEYILKDKSEVKSLIKKGKERVKDFVWQKTANELLKLIMQ